MDTPRASIALPLPLRRTFSYRIPPGLVPACQPGVRVVVPFGRRKMPGVLVSLELAPDRRHELRSLEDVLDTLPVLSPELLEFTRWVADYYFAPWGQVLQAALPGALRADRRRRLRFTPAGHLILEDPFARIRPRERQVLDLLARTGPMREETLRRRLAHATLALRTSLQSKGWMEALEEEIRFRRALGTSRSEAAPPAPASETPCSLPRLTPAQVKAASALVASIGSGAYSAFLLEGVTGSGKTEVYLAAATAALQQGLGVLYLVPEIGLTPLLARRLAARFPGKVALLHSGLTETERSAQWSRIRQGESVLVLGTRSALFAPHPRIGLVVVDEEQDSSYVQVESPRYNARDAALVRAQRSGATVVLGSATPSVEAVAAVRRGKFQRLVLPERILSRPLPEVHLIDMRDEFRATGTQSLLSRRLASALREISGSGDQALLLLNRRGFATFLLCRACGATLSCPGCNVALIYHRGEGRLRCHYCNSQRLLPRVCPACRAPHLHLGGAGTERLEEAIRILDPSLRVARMDRDTVKGRRHASFLERFERGEVDVLLGTQMVAKGHDFPGVTLVGVLSADAYLGLPDFRAAERTYQILTQVAGRAGRGDRPGKVLIQAFATDHYALRAAAAGEPQRFYDQELRLRKLMRYPPHVALTQILIKDRDLRRGHAQAGRVADLLRAASSGRFEVLGPSLSPLPRIRREYRHQILLKGNSRSALGQAVREVLECLEESGGLPRSLVVETDPVSLL